ncbi:MAG: hypothetical protein U0573_00455 [Phycisphaerales bacterium]|nr:hypothetical protein [Planctomycetota bacterium]
MVQNRKMRVGGSGGTLSCVLFAFVAIGIYGSTIAAASRERWVALHEPMQNTAAARVASIAKPTLLASRSAAPATLGATR